LEYDDGSIIHHTPEDDIQEKEDQTPNEEDIRQQQLHLEKILKTGKVKTRGGRIKNKDGETLAKSKKIK
jgi:hypothetical protein